MREVSIREARQRLRALLDDVAAGEEILLLRRGKAVALLVPATVAQRLPSLADFRRSIELRGTTLGEELSRAREEERY
jgi:prevent-host-death family protein